MLQAISPRRRLNDHSRDSYKTGERRIYGLYRVDLRWNNPRHGDYIKQNIRSTRYIFEETSLKLVGQLRKALRPHCKYRTQHRRVPRAPRAVLGPFEPDAHQHFHETRAKIDWNCVESRSRKRRPGVARQEQEDFADACDVHVHVVDGGDGDRVELAEGDEPVPDVGPVVNESADKVGVISSGDSDEAGM